MPGRFRKDAGGAIQSAAANGVALMAVSAGVAWLAGWNLLDPLILIPFTCLSAWWAARLAAGVVSRSFFPDDDIGRRVWHLGLGSGVAGWIMGVLSSAAAVLFLNVFSFRGAWLLPSVPLAGAAVLASLAAALTVSFWSLIVATDQPDAHAARRAMRIRLVMLLGCGVLLHSFIPVEWTMWLAPYLTTDGVVRITVAASAVLLILAGWLRGVAARRVAQWSATPPSLNTN